MTRLPRHALRPALATFVVLVAAVGCSRAPVSVSEEAPGGDFMGMGAPAPPAEPEFDAVAQAQPTAGAGSALPDVADLPSTGGPAVRRIIKNADMSIRVENVERALSRIGGAAAEAGGYVLETRTEHSEYAESATISVAVPVERFESTLERIRDAGEEVLSEHTSGTDVGQEFVDVQSQIANLEATQARVRQFLEQASNVEEALQVNARLTEIEGQLSQLKGRLEFLRQRSAFSTITVEVVEEPSPTPTATPVTVPWDPGKSAADAWATLRVLVQSLATLAIWLGIVVLPISLPFVAAVWLFRRSRRRTP